MKCLENSEKKSEPHVGLGFFSKFSKHLIYHGFQNGSNKVEIELRVVQFWSDYE